MESTAAGIAVRRLREEELAAAERIYREAFAAQIGLPDPEGFSPGTELIGFRWRKDPDSVFAAERAGDLIGSNVATNWGSIGVFGPLTVRPVHWNAGAGRLLIEAALAQLERWGCAHWVLYTFPESAKHLGLYHRYGYYPRFLTVVTAKELVSSGAARRTGEGHWERLSALRPSERLAALEACLELTDRIYEGLDVRVELSAVVEQGVGEAVLVESGGALDAFAVCHLGSGSEAETGTAYVKVAAARPGPGAGERFARLLAACEGFAREQGAKTLHVGVNLARERAARAVLGRGYRVLLQGVAMHRPNEPAYDRPTAYVLDDWR